MSKPSPVGTVMINAARLAGRSLARDFGEVENLQISKKGPADFVSNADHRAEEIIFDSLSKARPGYGFVMEERGIVEGTDKSNRFIVDPLDGTLNFLHGQPHYAVSIALEREGKLLTGVVYDVAKNEIFWAETGRGAWLDQRKLFVASRKRLEEGVFATGTPWIGKGEASHRQFAGMVRRRWTWPMSQRADLTASGNGASRPGTSQQVSCWCAKRAVSWTRSMAATYRRRVILSLRMKR